MIERIEELLKQLIGLHVSSIGRTAVERAMQQRMRDTRLADEGDYWRRVSADRAEQCALIDAVIVPETSFFRYPESYDALAREAVARYDGTPLRILSLPCATGEEPYSIAMAILDAGLPPGAFRIEAVDVSQRVLEHARAARYAERAFRGRDAAAAYFDVDGEDYVVAEPVRSSVGFRSGNLLDERLPASVGGAFDFVFCRNLLIYFDAPTRARAIDALKRLTRPDGLLFVAPAEAGLLTEAGMRSVGGVQSVAFGHALAAEHSTAPAPLPAPVVPKLVARLRRPAPSPLPVRGTPRWPVPATPSAPAVGKDVFAQAVALADGGRLVEARAAFERILEVDGPSAEAYFWLGLLADQAGDAARAHDHYRKALYLDPTHVEALGHLAALLAARGDAAGARALRLRAGAVEKAQGVGHAR